MKSLILAFVLILSCSLAMAFTDLPIAKCVACHTPTQGFPSLGAQNPAYLFQTMKDYQSGARHSDDAKNIMAKRQRGLDDDSLRALADYFSKTPAPVPVAGSPALIALGKDIYEKGIPAKGIHACAECHGRDAEGYGEGPKALAGGVNIYPRLAGQYQSFLAAQMRNYKIGLIDNQKEMTEISSKLSEDEINAVTTYLQSK